MDWLDASMAFVAIATALALRPWRALPAGGSPWPGLVWCALLPLVWSADRLANATLVQPLSGACLLLLIAGWPLAVLAMVPVTLLAAWLGALPWPEALHRGVWLGLVPATFALLLGAAVRRWLPKHLIVYVLGRGLFCTLLALALTGALALALHGGLPGLNDADLMLARWLNAWGDALITGMLTAMFVAFRPQWLATYTDRLYLPRAEPGPQ